MIPKSLSKILFVGGGNAVNAGLGFIFLAAVARSLSLDDFGKYALLVSLLITLSRLIDFGTNSVFVTRFIAEKDRDLNNTFVTLRFFLIFTSIPVFIALAWYFKILNLVTIIIFILGLMGYFFNFTFYAYFQKDERYSLLVLINTLPSIIKGLFAFLILFGLMKINLYTAYAVFGCSMLASLALLTYVPRELLKFRFNTAGVLNLLKTSAPAGLSQLIAESWPTINNGVAKILRGFSDVGIFSLANKLSGTFVIVSYSIFTVLLPKNAVLKKQHKGYDFKETAFLSMGVLILSVFTAFISRYLVPPIFGEKFTGSIGLLNILIFSGALTAIHTFIENFFFIENDTKTIFYINVTKLILFIFFMATLANIYGLVGLAYANLLSALIAVAVTTGITLKKRAILRRS